MRKKNKKIDPAILIVGALIAFFIIFTFNSTGKFTGIFPENVNTPIEVGATYLTYASTDNSASLSLNAFPSAKVRNTADTLPDSGKYTLLVINPGVFSFKIPVDAIKFLLGKEFNFFESFSGHTLIAEPNNPFESGGPGAFQQSRWNENNGLANVYAINREVEVSLIPATSEDWINTLPADTTLFFYNGKITNPFGRIAIGSDGEAYCVKSGTNESSLDYITLVEDFLYPGQFLNYSYTSDEPETPCYFGNIDYPDGATLPQNWPQYTEFPQDLNVIYNAFKIYNSHVVEQEYMGDPFIPDFSITYDSTEDCPNSICTIAVLMRFRSGEFSPASTVAIELKPIPGDVNLDGEVTQADLDTLNEWLKPTLLGGYAGAGRIVYKPENVSRDAFEAANLHCEREKIVSSHIIVELIEHYQGTDIYGTKNYIEDEELDIQDSTLLNKLINAELTESEVGCYYLYNRGVSVIKFPAIRGFIFEHYFELQDSTNLTNSTSQTEIFEVTIDGITQTINVSLDEDVTFEELISNLSQLENVTVSFHNVEVTEDMTLDQYTLIVNGIKGTVRSSGYTEAQMINQTFIKLTAISKGKDSVMSIPNISLNTSTLNWMEIINLSSGWSESGYELES